MHCKTKKYRRCKSKAKRFRHKKTRRVMKGGWGGFVVTPPKKTKSSETIFYGGWGPIY